MVETAAGGRIEPRLSAVRPAIRQPDGDVVPRWAAGRVPVRLCPFVVGIVEVIGCA
ncbi:MAG: hypothetical protein HY614_08750 [Candidatus Rokubacteria bacterium]|nr:hypothetical protein [Candidatus Rokubacteria bacterium]